RVLDAAKSRGARGGEAVEEGVLGKQPAKVRRETHPVIMPNHMSSPPGTIARGDLSVVRRLLPYLWEFRGRVLLALLFLVAAKLANITVPIVMKGIIDNLSDEKAIVAVPFTLLLAYGLLRLSSALFN